MLDAIIVYGHPTCPALGPVKGLLTQSKVKFEYIDIHQDSVAAARVRAINNGNESVPTLVFPDGSTLTEPTDESGEDYLYPTAYFMLLDLPPLLQDALFRAA